MGDRNGKEFIVGTVIGGVIGAATALLLAPKSGKELRTDLNEQAAYVRLKTEEFKNVAVEKGQGFAESAKGKTADFSQNFSKQSSNVMDKVKNFRNKEDDEISNAILQVLESEVEDRLEKLDEEVKSPEYKGETPSNQH